MVYIRGCGWEIFSGIREDIRGPRFVRSDAFDERCLIYPSNGVQWIHQGFKLAVERWRDWTP